MKIALVSGSRADVAALKPLARVLNAQWVDVGLTPLKDNLAGVARTFSEVAENAVDLLQGYDLVILAGDRYEIYAAASVAHLLRTPIAHLSGGDVTEGSLDDAMRNAITQLAHLHFPTSHTAAQRIIAMGEEPWRVHMVGCPSIDHLLALELYSREETLRQLGVAHPYYLVAYQPATLADDPGHETDELLHALDRLVLPCVFTTPNADAWGQEIWGKFARYCLNGRGVMLEMGQRLYASAMRHCLVMIGNSSSGFYEAPSLATPFVNIGDRQKGRTPAASVISCAPTTDAIIAAVAKAKRFDCTAVINPYGDGHAAERIAHVLSHLIVGKSTLLVKKRGAVNWPLTQHGSGHMPKGHGDVTLNWNLSVGRRTYHLN